MFALVQAAGLVDPNRLAQSGILRKLVQAGVQIALSIRSAGRARRIRRPRVMTHKYMTFKRWQLISPGKRLRCSSARSEDNSRVNPTPVLHYSHSAPRCPTPICENDALTMSPDNLLGLKDDMVAFIEGHGMRRLPGYVTEDIPSVLWEGQNNPDAWKDFVEMAKHVGAPFVTFSEMTLEREELDALVEQANEMNFPDEEATEIVEANWLRKYSGMVGYIQLGFVYQGIAFLHETTTEWYERFQALVDDIEGFQDIVIDDSESDEDE
jgi:hypothetical protein